MLALTLVVLMGQVPSSLSLDEALRIAHERQPQLKVARSQVDAAKARTGESLAPMLPQISAALGYSRSTANFVARPGALPSNLSSSSSVNLQSYDFFTSSLNANQLLWDFGQSWNRWQASKASLESQEATAKTSLVTVDLQVRRTSRRRRSDCWWGSPRRR
jgi:outer membrane protein